MNRRAESDASLFAITPGRGDAGELVEKIAALAAGGLQRLLLREKQLSRTARAALAQRVALVCERHHVQLWISEEVPLAIEVGAAGVQLSERSPSPLKVREQVSGLALGVSLHEPLSRSPEELAICAHAFLGPLFATPGKPTGAPLGMAGFARVAARLPPSLPLFALGGITLATLPALTAAGIARIAAIRFFFDAGDPTAVVREALHMLEGRASGAAARVVEPPS